MKQDIVIKVENISKSYNLGSEEYLTFRDTLVNGFKHLFGKKKKRPESVWALKNLNFDISSGEIVGIIGRNGAGKSTFLKILSRITEPTNGTITIKGKVASMLEVGTGFNPELTGRENIFLNGAILGMSRKEIRSKINEIIDFADIGEYIDEPVKYYSSGMYMRLAFAVSTNLESDVVLIDEILAVGDIEFQKKSFSKVSKIAGKGKTVVVVSHDIRTLHNLCTKIIVLEKGQVKYIGPAEKSIQKYLQSFSKDLVVDKPSINRTTPNTYGTKKIIKSISLEDLRGSKTRFYAMGTRIRIVIEMTKWDASIKQIIGCIITDEFGNTMFSTNSRMLDAKEFNVDGSKHATIAKFTTPELPLMPGKYYVSVSVTRGNIHHQYRVDYVENFISFEITPSDVYDNGYRITRDYGYFWLKGDWEIFHES